MNRPRRKSRFGARLGLALTFSLTVLLTLAITAVLVFACTYIAEQMGALDHLLVHGPMRLLPVLGLVSIGIGWIVALCLSHVALKSMRKIIDATNRLAQGDFSARLRIKGPPEMEDLGRSFNRMAEELGNTEMLRTDFVNTFSHEIKTPLVSIRGFAEMLRQDDLPANERQQYVDIVVSESKRLAGLATNVLDLAKVENQTILSDVSIYNLGEQVRRCIILLEDKIEEKELELCGEIEDVQICANEDLLSQVWTNLLSNAVKFTPRSGMISVTVHHREDTIEVAVWNSGSFLPEKDRAHVFDKFYQGAGQRQETGNGLGLALVRSIVELHSGNVSVTSVQDEGTLFTVLLPMRAGISAQPC